MVLLVVLWLLVLVLHATSQSSSGNGIVGTLEAAIRDVGVCSLMPGFTKVYIFGLQTASLMAAPLSSSFTWCTNCNSLLFVLTG